MVWRSHSCELGDGSSNLAAMSLMILSGTGLSRDALRMRHSSRGQVTWTCANPALSVLCHIYHFTNDKGRGAR